MNGIEKLNEVATRNRLLNTIQMVSKNKTHYMFSKDMARMLNIKRKVKHSDIDISGFDNIRFISSCDDDLIDTEIFM